MGKYIQDIYSLPQAPDKSFSHNEVAQVKKILNGCNRVDLATELLTSV